WRFASIPDLMRIIRAVLVGVALSAVVIFLMTRMQGLPRSVLPIYGLLLVGLLGGPRLLYRWWKDRALYRRQGERALIVGAGRAGELLVRDLHRDPAHGCLPAVFVDDDANKQRMDILDVPVVGTVAEIPEVLDQHSINVILIAVPSASTREMQRIVEVCETTGLPLRTMPRLGDLVSGRAAVSQLHEVSIEDLLGREPISLDWDAICAGLCGKRVLVTGGGGSIGSELCRQIARLKPAELVVLDNTEYSLYRIEEELRGQRPDYSLHARLGDVCDRTGMTRMFERYRPQVVFHAAAYKHVPVLEGQIREAVRNNLLGTATMAEVAAEAGVEKFVLISTDKAVNPTSVMGASKRAAEMVCQSYASERGTWFITVRFGNVLGSAGSVVPLFRQQIEAGGPVTVTHPEISRYFMTIPEACQLILQAGVMGEGGEIYVLDMGEPVKIHYLAEQMIRLSGRRPYEDIDIVFTGLRPGEKLYEELFHEDERLSGTGHEKILLARPRSVDAATLQRVLAGMSQAVAEFDEARLRRLLGELVPELGEKRTPEAPARVIPFPESAEGEGRGG
ncbi:MAG: polysaccharide biosynthesis protein, partial [Gammaproteobacteria bacterium]|nr:polysaccharide biosynthesis protein [Gammaproteobacteria bacterium]